MAIVHDDGQVELEDVACLTSGCGHNEQATHGVVAWTIVHCKQDTCVCSYNLPTPADSEGI